MKNLKVELNRNVYVKAVYNIFLTVKFWKFEIEILVFRRDVREAMGLCRVHVHCGTFYIFHWCDLCVVPKIKGVNL